MVTFACQCLLIAQAVMVTNLNVYFSLNQSGIVRDLECGENVYIHKELNIYDFARKAIKK